MTNTQLLKVRFRQDPRVDWIYLRFITGSDSITVRTSGVYSPYGQILRWLEAIAIGVDECGTTIEAEGPEFQFSFRRRLGSEDVGTLKVGRQAKRGYCFEADVGRAQLVNAIYQGFVRFTESPLYCRENWQEMNIGQWCCHRLNDRFSEDELIDRLLDMPLQDAEQELIRLWPGQYLSMEVKQTYEQYVYPLADEAAPPPRRLSSVGSLYVLAGTGASLAKLDYGQRRESLRGLFKCAANYICGEPIHKLRSPLVERYLTSKFSKNAGGQVVPITHRRPLASRAV